MTTSGCRIRRVLAGLPFLLAVFVTKSPGVGYRLAETAVFQLRGVTHEEGSSDEPLRAVK